jgi:hypothetical protein
LVNRVYDNAAAVKRNGNILSDKHFPCYIGGFHGGVVWLELFVENSNNLDHTFSPFGLWEWITGALRRPLGLRSRSPETVRRVFFPSTLGKTANYMNFKINMREKAVSSREIILDKSLQTCNKVA